LINEKKQVLVSDEYIRGAFYTKFPGGGLELGEGTRECLVREFREEMNLAVKVKDHIYTTDYCQPSAFKPNEQLIAIYYFAEALEPIRAPLRNKPFDFDDREMDQYQKTGETETFRFIPWEDFSEDSVTLPVDKIVARMIRYGSQVKGEGSAGIKPGKDS
jgi:8-oxo-dGTP diphosphatase